MTDLLKDPRHFQIVALSALLTVGIFKLDFDISAINALLIVVAACAMQCLGQHIDCTRLDLRSPLISSLSLCLLLRTDTALLAVTAAALAIGSKFVLRVDGRHYFNPTAFALVVMATFFDGVWISPGQWGHGAFLGLGVAALGLLVLTRAARLDVSMAFLLSFAAIAFARAAWLGDPWTIPAHQMNNGALLLFTFFMISDPRTTPDARAHRITFGVLVAIGAAYITFALYRPSGPLFALVAAALLVPLFNRLNRTSGQASAARDTRACSIPQPLSGI